MVLTVHIVCQNYVNEWKMLEFPSYVLSVVAVAFLRLPPSPHTHLTMVDLHGCVISSIVTFSFNH